MDLRFPPSSRPYDPRTGRFLTRDPDAAPGQNPYAALKCNPLNVVDPSGRAPVEQPGGWVTWFDKWSAAQRSAWWRDFRERYGKYIAESAERHCVPRMLLAAIAAAEMIDYSPERRLADDLGLGHSLGPAQITAETMDREGVRPSDQVAMRLNAAPWLQVRADWLKGRSPASRHLMPGAIQGVFEEGRVPEPIGPPPKWPYPFSPHEYLANVEGNLDIAGALLKRYLDILCDAIKIGKASASFQRDVAGPQGVASLSKFCCNWEEGCSPHSGKTSTGLASESVPKAVVQAILTMWNNGPKVLSLTNIPKQAESAFVHGISAGELAEESPLKDFAGQWR